MIIGESDSSTKDQPALSAFIERASGRLAGVRNGILIFDRDKASAGDLEAAVGNLELLALDAAENEHADLAGLVQQCESNIRSMLRGNASPTDIGHALDAVAGIEEVLLQIPLASDDFLDDISGFVENSFGFLQPDESPESLFDEAADFEIDDETLEIFRTEAAELLRNITANVGKLHSDPDDREALWEVRRHAHTFKGAAGIIGLTAASTLAHRVEDILDKMVETNAAVDKETVELLAAAAKRLEIFTLGTEFTEEGGPIDVLYSEFERIIASIPARRLVGGPADSSGPEGPTAAPAVRAEDIKPAATPIVRVSLDRLDDLIALSRDMLDNRSAIVDLLAALSRHADKGRPAEALGELREILDDQHVLADVMRERLSQIRMVRFGTLETRLARAVHVTCEEENKSAALSIENGDCEIDTQVIDALVEPLLHLLKNAVVHGIEDAETRRLIGKPEKGRIQVKVRTDDLGTTIEISDDGRGISASRLKQKAVDQGLMAPAAAGKMSESDAFELIFHRGLTTADRLNLNAGRGIGMSIVKQSIDSHGGVIRIHSEPQAGTTFILEMPLAIHKFKPPAFVAASDSGTVVSAADHDALVLVVDDSASIRRQTSKLVEAAGHRVITATNGAEAIELLLSNVWRPDLILSDVEMPVMDGWEFLECVRSSDDLAGIPVVMVTSLSAVEYVKKAFQLGAADYRIKPLCAPDIATLIESAAAAKNPI